MKMWWCIASGRMLLPFTIRSTRHDAIKAIEEAWDTTFTLRPDLRVVKVQVSEVVP